MSRRAGPGSRCMACACVLGAAKRSRCATAASFTQHVCLEEALVDSLVVVSPYVVYVFRRQCLFNKERLLQKLCCFVLQNCLLEYAALHIALNRRHTSAHKGCTSVLISHKHMS